MTSTIIHYDEAETPNPPAPDRGEVEPIGWRWRDSPDEPWSAYFGWMSAGGIAGLRTRWAIVEPLYSESALTSLQQTLQERTAERDEWERRYRMDGVCEIAAVNPNVASYMDHWERRAEAAEASIQSLEAENASLKEALKKIADHPEEENGPNGSYSVGWAFWNVKSIARSALAITGKQQDTEKGR